MAKPGKLPKYQRGEVGPRTRTPVDKDRINDKCKSSCVIPEYYESYDSQCRGCGRGFHVSAGELKHIHEDLRIIIWARIDRCPACQSEWRRIKVQARDLMQQSVREFTSEEAATASAIYKRYIALGGRRSVAFEVAIQKVQSG